MQTIKVAIARTRSAFGIHAVLLRIVEGNNEMSTPVVYVTPVLKELRFHRQIRKGMTRSAHKNHTDGDWKIMLRPLLPYAKQLCLKQTRLPFVARDPSFVF